MKVAVISDTHGLLREEVVSYLRECDVVFHAGDVTSELVGSMIRDVKRTHFVRGNCDEPWRHALPYTLLVEEGGFTFAMAHRCEDLPADTKRFDIGIFGHTHCYEKFVESDGTIFLNPGSCGTMRYGSTCSMAILYLDEEKHTCRVERIDINPNGVRYNPLRS